MRHNDVSASLGKAMRKSGVVPEMEPAGYYSHDDRRPDIFAVLNGRATFIDVGIVHPAAPCNRNKKPLAAAEAYVNVKVNKYRRLAEDNDAAIVPFIVETGGGYTEQAKHVIDDIIAHAQEHAVAFTPESIREELLDSIAIAIQRGNAMAMRRCREYSCIDRQRRSRPSSAQRRQIRARLQPINVSPRRRPHATIVPRHTVDVDVEPTTDDERVTDSPIEQPVAPPASPSEDVLHIVDYMFSPVTPEIDRTV
jgi:hypothetical protein